MKNKKLILKIISILEQDGDEKTDGECLDEIIEAITDAGYKINFGGDDAAT